MIDFNDAFLLVLTFIISIFASIISGMAGGGSGFVIAPFFLLIGIPPNLATATAKMNEVGINASCIAAAISVKKRTPQTANQYGSMPAVFLPLLAITLVNVGFAAWLIPRLQADGMQYAVAFLLLLMIPTLFIDKKAFKPGARKKNWKNAGFVVYYVVSFFQALFGMGIGMFISMVLMYMFGLPASEANHLKRRLMLFQSVILLILLLAQGAVLLTFGIAALLGAIIGGQIGTRIGLKKGNIFIKKAMAMSMAVSAVVLLF